MSWYNRKPRIKEPPKQIPHHTSPATERMMEEAKKSIREKPKKTK